MNKLKIAAGVGTGVAAVITAAAIMWPTHSNPKLAGVNHSSNSILTASVNRIEAHMTKPAAASNAWRWKFQEASGNLVDDMSGAAVPLVPNGTVYYRLGTELPTATGFDRKALGLVGNKSELIQGWYSSPRGWIQAADSSFFNQTTGNFCVSIRYRMWVNNPWMWLISKRNAVTNRGFELYWSNLAIWTFAINDGAAIGAPTSSAAWFGTHLLTASVDRTTTKTIKLYFDGVAQSSVDISGHVGSLTSTTPFTVGYLAGQSVDDFACNVQGPTPPNPCHGFIGGLAELMLADGTCTLAEHQSWYHASAPTGVTLSSAVLAPTPPGIALPNTKYALLPPDANGTRMGIYAVGKGQFPVGYNATRVAAVSNPLGTCFPADGNQVNYLGYPDYAEEWPLGVAHPVVTPNVAEAPNGGFTADRLAFSLNGQYIYKYTGVPYVVMPVGKKYFASIWYRKISGNCSGIALVASSGNGCYSFFGNSTTWTRQVTETFLPWQDCSGEFPGFTIYATAHGDCVMEIAHGAFEADKLTPAPCLTVDDDGPSTCGATYYKQTMPLASYMPTEITRMSISSTSSPSYYKRQPSTGGCLVNISSPDWTKVGAPAIVQDSSVATLGTCYADKITFSANSQYVAKYVDLYPYTMLGVGEVWWGGVYYRVISGSCLGVNLVVSSDNRCWGAFADNAAWTWLSVGTNQGVQDCSGAYRAMTIYALVHGNCVMEIANAQYEPDPATAAHCTLSNCGERRVLTVGDDLATVSDNVPFTGAVVKNHAGGDEIVSPGVVMPTAAASRSYVSEWNIEDNEGLTNTSPRLYGGYSVNGTRTTAITAAKAKAAGGSIFWQSDANATVFTVGCKPDGTVCYEGCVETADVYARPMQTQ